MSTPNESTPLISTSSHADPQRHRLADQHADSSIEARSQAILTSLIADVDGPIQLDSGPVNFFILLYASDRLRDFLGGLSLGNESVTSILAWERLESGVRDRLNSEIGKVLDSLGRGEVDDETLYEALWRRWEVGHRRLSALDLIIEQDERRNHRYLSHPVIVHFVKHLYRRGPLFINHKAPKGVLRTAESAITPRRAHILHLVSYLALWVLTIISAMRPDTWATRTSPISTHSALDIIWMIVTSAAIVQVFQHPRLNKDVFLLPSALSLITYWSTYGFTFLTLSIPFLTVSLIRPGPPSIPFLFPSILPNCIDLWDVVVAGFTGWAILWPLIIILCVILSISLNGDIFRGFFVLTTISDSDPLVEEGIAPYGTRVAIFGTILTLIYLAICLSISNMASRLARRTQRSEERQSESETQARVEMILGTRSLLGDLGQESGSMEDEADTGRLDLVDSIYPPVPLPFNLLVVPLDIVLVILGLARFMSRDENKGGAGRIIRRMRLFMAVLMIGIPCWGMSLVY